MLGRLKTFEITNFLGYLVVLVTYFHDVFSSPKTDKKLNSILIKITPSNTWYEILQFLRLENLYFLSTLNFETKIYLSITCWRKVTKWIFASKKCILDLNLHLRLRDQHEPDNNLHIPIVTQARRNRGAAAPLDFC